MVACTSPVLLLLKTATTACKQAGFPVGEIEYQSAINWAVAQAMLRHGESRSWACVYAIRQCRKVGSMFRGWRRQDQAGAGRGLLNDPIKTPVPLSDFNVLTFVATHGKFRAARMLRMRYAKLIELLDDISLRLRS